MSKTKPTFDWPAWQARLAAELTVLEPFRKLLRDYFASQVEAPGEYDRRPTIGLKLDLPEGRTLAIRPGWHGPARFGRRVIKPGLLDCERITLEIAHPSRSGAVFEAVLSPGAVRGTRARFSHDDNLSNLQAVLDVARDFVTDPLAVIGRQAARCCCCHKILTDIVSRTRGYGPECFGKVSWFTTRATRREVKERP
jgi:hypothetical protein